MSGGAIFTLLVTIGAVVFYAWIVVKARRQAKEAEKAQTYSPVRNTPTTDRAKHIQNGGLGVPGLGEGGN